MADYHKYVFDRGKRQFVGQFEKMYMNEVVENFDSWCQDDSRQLTRRIALSILEEWNFRTIIDVGSGKGALTSLLKKRNNHVVGFDKSATAVGIAKSRFFLIDFEDIDANNIEVLDNQLQNKQKLWEGIDLVFTSECLSYLENWREFLKIVSHYANFLMVSLYIPKNPIGFVKSQQELEDEIKSHFDIIESIKLSKSNHIVIFAKSCAV